MSESTDTRKALVPTTGAEQPMLRGWLDFHRQTLLMKCAGLSDEQLKTASAPPSNLTLLGLVRHMAEVERGWFRNGLAGADLGEIYCTPDDEEKDFEDLANASVADDLRTFDAECRAADEAVAGMELDHAFTDGGHGPFSLRWVYLHMIEEYARHNGHADLIRERIDGATGD
jgi:uncharacterized damage-inducible protein DinB